MAVSLAEFRPNGVWPAFIQFGTSFLLAIVWVQWVWQRKMVKQRETNTYC